MYEHSQITYSRCVRIVDVTRQKKMFRIDVHKNIRRIISFFYLMGFWHRQDVKTVGRKISKFFYSIYHCLAPVSMMTAAFTCEHMDDSIFLIKLAIMNVVLVTKFLYIIWRKNETLELFNCICNFSIDDHQTFLMVDNKLKNFMKFVMIFLSTSNICGISFAAVSSFIGTERTLFIPIAFPLDWRNDEFAFWIAYVFIVTEMIIGAVSILFTVIIWYLLAMCSWRFEVLGNQIEKIGKVREEGDEEPRREVLNATMDDLYQADLLKAVLSKNYLNRYR